jgi:DivIVA domain-containing protein
VTPRDEHVFPYYRSPQEIRDESFTRRLRGFDENEVREYLSLLADQVQSLELERAEMIAELEHLRGGDQGPREHSATSPSRATAPAPEGGQAATVLSHAQDVADQLLDAASRQSREIVAAAQAQGQEVIRQARARTFDRMQALYDELDGDFRRLGDAMRLYGGSDDHPPVPPRRDL